MRMIARIFAVSGAVGELSAGWEVVPAAAQAPIKIGFLSPMSGAIAQAGKDMYSGCGAYWPGRGMAVAARDAQVALEAPAGPTRRHPGDTHTDHLLAGVLLPHLPYALVAPIQAAGIPAIYPITSADD